MKSFLKEQALTLIFLNNKNFLLKNFEVFRYNPIIFLKIIGFYCIEEELGV